MTSIIPNPHQREAEIQTLVFTSNNEGIYSKAVTNPITALLDANPP
jgi:hypothetical protein